VVGILLSIMVVCLLEHRTCRDDAICAAGNARELAIACNKTQESDTTLTAVSSTLAGAVGAVIGSVCALLFV
ncbi:unnamed protein product, partial [Polarella glacialis]